MHKPVLLKEAIKFLEPEAGKFIIDGTIDGGGHAGEILKKISPQGRLLGVDWDEEMIAGCEKRLANKKNTILVRGNYVDLPKILEEKKLGKADGMLLDLGFSSEQLESGRGFSFEKDEPLLMTYDDARQPVKEILEKIDVKTLAKVISDYSGERFAMRIAAAIKNREATRKIETTRELREIILSAVPKDYERGRIDPATRTFQALRIYANGELENLENVLKNLRSILKRGGRAVVISFHSLEDGIVKRRFRLAEKSGELRILTKKPIVPSAAEVLDNPGSRSAKLRAAQLV